MNSKGRYGAWGRLHLHTRLNEGLVGSDGLGAIGHVEGDIARRRIARGSLGIDQGGQADAEKGGEAHIDISTLLCLGLRNR